MHTNTDDINQKDDDNDFFGSICINKIKSQSTNQAEEMSFFRSAKMEYYNLIIPRESSWNVMNELGELECLHLIDYDPLLPVINRPFANYVKRCDDSLFKLNVISAELRLFKKQVIYCEDVKPLISYFKSTIKNRAKASHTYFEEIEAMVESRHKMVTDQMINLSNLEEQMTTAFENKQVLVKGLEILGQNFFQPKNYEAQGFTDLSSKSADEVQRLQMSVKFNQMVGLILKDDGQRFQKIVFRITKGNVWVTMTDVDQQVGINGVDKSPRKSVFVVVFPGGGESGIIKRKLEKVSEAFGVSKINLPEAQNDFQKTFQLLDAQLNETRNLIALTKNQIDAQLDQFTRVQNYCNCSLIEELKLYIIREKYLYTNLNYMRIQGSVLYGQVWIPLGQAEVVNQRLQAVSLNSSMPSGQLQISKPEGKIQPPTYFKINAVTQQFQEIVNTYGIPRYQEINPGLFTVTTFPFLFGVMFADIGHGFCLFMLGMYLLFAHNSIAKSDSALKPLIPARYMFTMMGICAFYNGWIYNDFISLSINAFGSCYKLDQAAGGPTWVLTDPVAAVADPKTEVPQNPCTYPFGIDPVWASTTDELTFVNSYKMKLAVIIGVIHMLFGIAMKGLNSVYFRNWLDFIFEFIPQFIFMACTFGLMDFLIIYKWLEYFPNPSDAPSIITLMINMVLTPTAKVDPALWGDGVGEQKIQLLLLLSALACVPIMLLPKPIILTNRNKGHHSELPPRDSSNQPLLDQKMDYMNINIDEENKQEDSAILVSEKSLNYGKASQLQSHEQGGHEDSSEIFVHQVIESIEFVLGSISNTASYLRLWALSLAHGQLAEVFFTMTLSGFIKKGGISGYISLLFGYVIFSFATFGVLMLMDVMECFLHALRLHWVEFQNKFYKADGYLFVSYSYCKVMNEAAQPPPE